MKPIIASKDIVPLNVFKARASQLFRQLREGQRPLIITRNGKPAGVLITPEEFDRIRERDRFIDAVKDGLADSVADRLIDDDELEARLDAEFGPLE
jgi:prevent-host-death family protein